MADEQDKTENIVESAEIPKPLFGVRLKKIVTSKQFKIGAPIVAVVIIASAIFIEPVKFTLLNIVSSGSAELVVVDTSTLVPVEKATVTIAGKTATTDKNGKLSVTGIDFGTTSYTIKKETYTTIQSTTKIKTGNNLVGPIKFKSEGIPLTIKATNKLSRESIKQFKVTVAGSQISSQANKDGVAILRVPLNRVGEVALVITSDGYNDSEQKITVSTTGTAAPIVGELVPTGKHYFLSNRTGKIAVFSANLDGSSQTEVIAGTTIDGTDTTISISPNGTYAALVSKRDNLRDASGELMTALFAIDLQQKTIKRIDEGAPSFRMHGWSSDSQLVYTVNYNDYTRADNSKIKTADIATNKLETLHSQTNYLDVFMFQEDKSHIYFNNVGQTPVDLYGFISIDVKTKAKKRLVETPVYDFKHSRPAVLGFKVASDWRELDMKTQNVKTVSQPSDQYHYFVVSPDAQNLAWMESRDGKGTLIVANTNAEDQKQIPTSRNFGSIVNWIQKDYIIYNFITPTESADYIVHIPSGTNTKISDVYGGRSR